MKNNKIITVTIIVLIVAIVTVLGVLVFQMVNKSAQTGNNGTQNNIQTNTENTEGNENNEIENNNNEENSNGNTIIEPILNEITQNPNNTQTTESFIATYYYSQLDENAKALYDGLKQNKEKLISGNYTVDYGTKFNTLLHTEGGEEKLNIAFQSAWNAFSYDNMDLFYIDVTKMNLTNTRQTIGGITTYKIAIGPGENQNYFQSSFKTKEEVEWAKYYLEDIRKQILEQTNTNARYAKIQKVHNWLISFVEYDESTSNDRNKYTTYGALKDRKAVCEGYARAFKYLMDGVNVPCVLVSGTATNSTGEEEAHAWNYVQIDERWYAIDTTWDDPVITGGGTITDEIRYRYFMKGSEEFFKNHKESGKISENSTQFKFPTLSTQNYVS